MKNRLVRSTLHLTGAMGVVLIIAFAFSPIGVVATQNSSTEYQVETVENIESDDVEARIAYDDLSTGDKQIVYKAIETGEFYVTDPTTIQTFTQHRETHSSWEVLISKNNQFHFIEFDQTSGGNTLGRLIGELFGASYLAIVFLIVWERIFNKMFDIDIYEMFPKF